MTKCSIMNHLAPLKCKCWFLTKQLQYHFRYRTWRIFKVHFKMSSPGSLSLSLWIQSINKNFKKMSRKPTTEADKDEEIILSCLYYACKPLLAFNYTVFPKPKLVLIPHQADILVIYQVVSCFLMITWFLVYLIEQIGKGNLDNFENHE